MDDNEFSNDDESMGSGSHIPTDTGINNSDAESISMDGNDNSDDEDQRCYHTNNGTDQEKLSTGDNTETNEDENEENGSDGDGRNADDDRSMCSTEEELLKIVEKRGKSRGRSRVVGKGGR